MARIGFIGLGNMGGPMARNLLKAGHHVKAFDLQPALTAKAVEAGALAASSPAEAASEVEAVITMLPAGQHVRTVYLGEGRVLESAAPGTLLIDSSTIDVETARTCLPAGSMVTTASTSRAACAGEAAASAPASTAFAVKAGTRSKTLRRWPAFSRLRAIGPPILPRPMNPIRAMGFAP